MKHILFILTDQQRKDTVGFYGDPQMQTPNLDALAREGAVFDNCYTTSPVCVPARFSLFSGQYCNRHGNSNNNSDHVYPGDGVYSMLTDAGYRSCCVGKMHHTIDPYGPMGFEKRITQEEIAHPEDDYTKFIRENYPWVYDYHGMRSEMYYVPQISQLPPSAHPTQWIGDHAVEYIRNFDPSEPMMLMASFIHPHPPFAPPAPWHKLYREDPVPPHIPEEENLDTFRDMFGKGGTCERLQISPQDLLRQKNFYHACVSFVDYQVGRIIDALKEKEMYDDTMIVFTSDHGDMMGDFGCVGKRNMVDGAANVPLIVRCPGRAPERSDKPCSIVDIAPTLFNYAGIDYDPSEFDGLDLLGTQQHDYVYSQYSCGPEGTYMVTDGQKKLVYDAKQDKYFWFTQLPEIRNEDMEGDADAMEMKKQLDAYRAAETNSIPGASSHVKRKKKLHPHYPGRVDQVWTLEQEEACIPEAYHGDFGN